MNLFQTSQEHCIHGGYLIFRHTAPKLKQCHLVMAHEKPQINKLLIETIMKTYTVPGDCGVVRTGYVRGWDWVVRGVGTESCTCLGERARRSKTAKVLCRVCIASATIGYLPQGVSKTK